MKVICALSQNIKVDNGMYYFRYQHKRTRFERDTKYVGHGAIRKEVHEGDKSRSEWENDLVSQGHPRLGGSIIKESLRK